MHSGSKNLMLIALAALVFATTPPARGQTETVLYSFAGYPNDGAGPVSGLVLDKKGNLYGTTLGGGTYCGVYGGCGTVFELTPSGTETILHSFGAGGTDGVNPSAGLVLDKKGNLYGTTTGGGAYCCVYDGTVFKLTASGTETILHSFGGSGADGNTPIGGLIRDTKGNLYGTTNYGGGYCSPYGCGTVFELTASGTETILHSFDNNGTDGAHPRAGLVLDKLGNLYGTTTFGGAYGFYYGTVFEITASDTETILHSFDLNGTDGYQPFAGMVDKKGNLYGTTSTGGAYDYGTLFKLTASGTETILHSFDFNGTDGWEPLGSLVLDKKGNLYGTTYSGGSSSSCQYGCGTVFKLTPSGTETILHSFDANGTDGYYPNAGLVLDKEGNLYGTTYSGGAYGYGTVFKVTP